VKKQEKSEKKMKRGSLTPETSHRTLQSAGPSCERTLPEEADFL
jgi:hypothetical protein